MKIGEFIQEKMNAANISQAELARRSGVPASTISSIISRNNDRIAIEMLINLCDVLECDVEEYISALKKEPVKQMPSSFAKKYYALDSFGKELIDKALEIEYERCTYIEEEKAPTITISCSQLPASAGNGEFLSDENLKDEEFPDCENARRADIVIPVSGRSMEPVFHDGDKLYVRLQPAVEVGEYGIFIIDGSGYVKEYAEDRLISLNPDYADIYPDESSECKCVGKVLGKV